MSLTDKIKYGALALVCLMLVSGLTAWVAKDRTSEAMTQQFQTQFAAQVTMTASAEEKVTELTRQVEDYRHQLKTASEFRNRLAVKDVTGKIQLDGKGRPVYDYTQGSSSSDESEDLRRALDKEREQNIKDTNELRAALNGASESYNTLLRKTSKRSVPRLRIELGWLADWGQLLTNRGRLSFGAGPKFALGPATMDVTLSAVLPQFGDIPEDYDYWTKKTQGRIGIGLDY